MFAQPVQHPVLAFDRDGPGVVCLVSESRGIDIICGVVNVEALFFLFALVKVRDDASHRAQSYLATCDLCGALSYFRVRQEHNIGIGVRLVVIR